MSTNRYDGLTAAMRNNVIIPASQNLQCSWCKKFKKQEHYSNKQINEMKNKMATGVNLTNAARLEKLVCRICKGEQAQELQCDGPCEKWKPLDSFSKSQRKGGTGWCIECVLWKESDEPAVPLALPPGAPGSVLGQFGTFADVNDDTASSVMSVSTMDDGSHSVADRTFNVPQMLGGPGPSRRWGSGASISQSSVSNPYENAATIDLPSMSVPISKTAWSVGLDSRRRGQRANVGTRVDSNSEIGSTTATINGKIASAAGNDTVRSRFAPPASVVPVFPSAGLASSNPLSAMGARIPTSSSATRTVPTMSAGNIAANSSDRTGGASSALPASADGARYGGWVKPTGNRTEPGPDHRAYQYFQPPPLTYTSKANTSAYVYEYDSDDEP